MASIDVQVIINQYGKYVAPSRCLECGGNLIYAGDINKVDHKFICEQCDKKYIAPFSKSECVKYA